MIDMLGKERPLSLRMLAVKEYKTLTGFNLLSPNHRLTDIFGDGKELEPSADLMIALIFVMLKSGDPEFKNTIDDVARDIKLADLNLAREVTRVYIEEMTGKPFTFEENGKNLQALEKAGA